MTKRFLHRRIFVTGKRLGFTLVEPGVHWTYAEKNGHAVLKWETHWTKINGFVVSNGRRAVFFVFRRRGQY